MSESSIVFRNVRLVDSVSDSFGDLYVENGVIVDYLPPNARVIDGCGLVLMPAFVDLHVHFREPGLTYKEDIVSGSKAAVAGGYTTVVMMANTKPVCSSLAMMQGNEQRAKAAGLVDAVQCLSITRNFDGVDLSHIAALPALHGCKIISDDGYGVENEAVMRKALMLSKAKGLVVSSHAEYREIASHDARASENSMTERDVRLALETGGRLHMAHVSTMEAIGSIVKGKEKGAALSCEVTPHHLALSEEDCQYRVNPPLRTKEDIKVLTAAIKRGYVDAIATDHAPHTAQDKENGAPGMVGLETAFAVCYSTLVKSGEITLVKLSELMSRNGAKILSLKQGLLAAGSAADLVLLDLEARSTVDTHKFYSKGENTPFAGRKYWSKVVMTLKNGNIVYGA